MNWLARLFGKGAPTPSAPLTQAQMVSSPRSVARCRACGLAYDLNTINRDNLCQNCQRCATNRDRILARTTSKGE